MRASAAVGVAAEAAMHRGKAAPGALACVVLVLSVSCFGVISLGTPRVAHQHELRFFVVVFSLSPLAETSSSSRVYMSSGPTK